LSRHQNGYVESAKFASVTLVTYNAFNDQSKGYLFEKYLESGSGRAFLNKHFV